MLLAGCVEEYQERANEQIHAARYAEVLEMLARTAEPDAAFAGYRGLEWGVRAEDVPDRLPAEALDGPGRGYRRNGEPLKVGEARVERVYYRFVEGRLVGVRMEYRQYANFARLRDWMLERAGEPLEFFRSRYDLETPVKDEYDLTWLGRDPRGRRVLVRLVFDRQSEGGRLVMTDLEGLNAGPPR
jgi:hypothetical protein